MFRKKRSRRLIYIIFFFVLIFSINRFFLPFSDMLRYSYSVILRPVFLSQEYLINPIKNIFAERKSRQELEKLVFKLSRMHDNLIAENINLRATVSYYDQIKEVLEFKRKYETENLHFCKILFKHINQNSHFVYIDKGFANGIENDMVAIYSNFLLGKIVETYKFYSKVLLVTDKSCKVSAYCELTGANGISEGINLLDQISLNRISHLEQVQVDDIVLSSGHGLVFPQGFALGKIVAVQKDELYNTVKVQPMFNIKNINYCFLLKKGDYKGYVNNIDKVEHLETSDNVDQSK
ncbi:MAG: Cell shape-determining protein MreC [candidate division TM6 bacterium GW2011_GWF2_30_66]|nr:MAG: Cell shape-determining protein MreC [candidate division TM6 bacterium GW2011_GWF2_30_66]